MKTFAIVACMAIVAACAWVLFSGSELLDAELPFAFPAGNVVAAALMVAAAAIAVLLDAPGPKRRAVARATLIAAIGWLPVSMALAGGMQLSDSGWQGAAWMAYTFALLLGIPVVLGWSVVVALLSQRRRDASAAP